MATWTGDPETPGPRDVIRPAEVLRDLAARLRGDTRRPEGREREQDSPGVTA